MGKIVEGQDISVMGVERSTMATMQGRIAAVTGAGRGNGKAIAQRLSQEGAHLIILDRNLETAEATAADLCALGKEAVAVKIDIADRQEVYETFARLIEQYGRIDVLVNNAGIPGRRLFVETPDEDWDAMVAVILKGTYNCCKAVFPSMIARRSGTIINIASVAGKRGGGLLGRASYAACKAGVIGLTKGLAREGAQYGVRVNGICPSLIDTEGARISAEQFERVIAMIPLGRAGKPSEIGAAVAFLASDDASFITGEIMDVDGGLTMD